MTENIQDRFKKLVKANEEQKLLLAKTEQKLESLKEQQDKLINQLKEYNISKEDLDKKLDEMLEDIEGRLSKCEGIFNAR